MLARLGTGDGQRKPDFLFGYIAACATRAANIWPRAGKSPVAIEQRAA